jgi:hypothetical protein
MKKIKLYELFIRSSSELNASSLFDEGFFYKQWLEYINFSDFQKQVFGYLDNIKVIEIKGFADQDHFFAYNAGYGYELLPKCYKYYDKRKLNIETDFSYALFTRLEYAVDYKKAIKKNVNSWLSNIRLKEDRFKSVELANF